VLLPDRSILATWSMSVRYMVESSCLKRIKAALHNTPNHIQRHTHGDEPSTVDASLARAMPFTSTHSQVPT
jgi:hypothetical protein